MPVVLNLLLPQSKNPGTPGHYSYILKLDMLLTADALFLIVKENNVGCLKSILPHT